MKKTLLPALFCVIVCCVSAHAHTLLRLPLGNMIITEVIEPDTACKGTPPALSAIVTNPVCNKATGAINLTVKVALHPIRTDGLQERLRKIFKISFRVHIL